ncbi:uncharacterized protein FYW49_008943 [Xenentodon cancila]
MLVILLLITLCHSQASCHCSSPRDVTHTIASNKASSVAQAKEIVFLTRECGGHEPQSCLRGVDERSNIPSSDDGKGSFTQAVTHRLCEGFRADTSSSPHSPIFSRQDRHSSKHRSHSFTSATYQKIKPMLHSPVEKGSNYSVTLVVGDKSTDSSPGSRSSDPPLLASAGWEKDTYEDSALRGYTSLPRPRNKSVFRKFFGKKDL